VVDGENGLVVPPGDAPALRDALLRLLDEPDRRRRLGEAAVGTAAELSLDRTLNRHVELFQRLAS
jgi:glycosyltransferase involved in cell wall biosynthesis